MTTMPSASKGPTICSLIDLKVDLSEDVYDHLRRGYKRHYQALGGSEADAEAQAIKHMDRLLDAMKKPPKTSVLRVNTIKSNKEEVISELEKEMNSWLSQFEGARDCMESVVQDSPDFDDVVTIDIVPKDATSSSLYERPGPLPGVSIFSDQPNRQWPLTHRVVVCDRFCGEAVLRGSDIFVRGVLAADAKIRAGEQVAVYADVWHDSKITKRGMLVETYTGRCVFLGMGTSVCKRADFFNSFKGLAVRMSSFPSHRAGPLLPPLSHVLSDKAFLQNLPSILVAHVLDPRPSDIILDMCSAPGGKTSHVASLVQNQATIIACDISRKKMVAAKELFDRLGARITPLAMDSTACVNESETQETVAEVRCEGRKEGSAQSMDYIN